MTALGRGCCCLLLLAACGEGPRQLGEAARQRLQAHAEPSSWEDLDPARPGARLRDPRTGIVFVRVPAGEFRMGSARSHEGPRHRVRLTRPYLLAETEVTIGQWKGFVAGFAGDAAVPLPPGGDALPMQVHWLDASAFCATFGYRLPTEAEWQHACLGGLDPDSGPWRVPQALEQHAWCHTNSPRGSSAVGTRVANPFGLYDMLGNLWEWCSDHYGPGYPGRPDPDVDPQGPLAGAHRVLRGGSWFTVPRPDPHMRLPGFPDVRDGFSGFRPARSL